MKFGIILSLIAFVGIISTSSFCQFRQNNALYFDAGYATNRYTGFAGHLNYVRNYKLGISAGVLIIDRESPNTPSDYDGGTNTWLTQVSDQIIANSVGIGYMIPINQNNSIRFFPKIGLSYFQTRKAINWEKKNPEWLFDSNYSFDYKHENKFGFILNSSVEIAFSRYLGLVFDPHFLFMKNDFHVSFELGLIFGIIRDQKMKLNSQT